MAATAAVNRPPTAHPGPNGGNLHTRTNGAGPTSQQQDPGLHGTGQDPGPSSLPQHHISARPVFYVPAPPPPPYLHYQWPMPFSYNPFAGFPGMGYGMVMPPFPPPPYMEAPAYILPHPHLQPVDYRRLLHPQVHAPSVPYQIPNQTRRVRPPHAGPVRETVNSEVQTEPAQGGIGGYGEGSSDSGRGTASNSPSPSSSSSKKRGSAEVENDDDASDTQVKRNGASSAVNHRFNVLHPAGTKPVQSCIRATVETQKSRKEGVGLENGRCNMWSVSSQDSMVPVCSSSQREEDVVRERRISVPDILMSWGGGTPQGAMPQNDGQLPSYETEEEHKSLYPSPTESKKHPVVADFSYADNDAEGPLSAKDSATLFKILKLREAESRREHGTVEMVGSARHCPPYGDELVRSLNASSKHLDDEQESINETNPHEDTTDVVPYQMSFCQMKRKMNESVWSVESLAPFVPKEWLQQNTTFEPEAIVEMIEEAENEDLIAKASKERRQTRRRSSSDSVLVSDSWLAFSTPAEKRNPPKKPEMESETDASEMRGPEQSQSVAPSEKDPSASLIRLLQSEIILSTPPEEDVNKNGSSEPEANRSPNQESVVLNEQQEKSPCCPQREETLPLNSAAEESVPSAGQILVQNGVDMEAEDEICANKEVGNDKLRVPAADQKVAELSPAKGHLVDCGIQCTELQEKCLCEAMKSSMGPGRRQLFKYSDLKKANNGHADGFCTKGHLQKNQKRHHWRNRGQEKHSGQQEAYAGYCGKPGKPQGGNGRNPRY